MHVSHSQTLLRGFKKNYLNISAQNRLTNVLIAAKVNTLLLENQRGALSQLSHFWNYVIAISSFFFLCYESYKDQFLPQKQWGKYEQNLSVAVVLYTNTKYSLHLFKNYHTSMNIQENWQRKK